MHTLTPTLTPTRTRTPTPTLTLTPTLTPTLTLAPTLTPAVTLTLGAQLAPRYGRAETVELSPSVLRVDRLGLGLGLGLGSTSNPNPNPYPNPNPSPNQALQPQLSVVECAAERVEPQLMPAMLQLQLVLRQF